MYGVADGAGIYLDNVYLQEIININESATVDNGQGFLVDVSNKMLMVTINSTVN
jgi:hypothetical protein